MTDDNIEFFQTLESIIEQRKGSNSEESYTAQLFSAGPARIAQKVGEEGVELALAAAQGNKKDIVSEAADLLFHILVLLKSHDLSLTDVSDELRRRHR
jgi:phosphoribosyl-ATP pyrophosphohydrolase/phosphoribosyl-AMP cyclohydrolase